MSRRALLTLAAAIVAHGTARAQELPAPSVTGSPLPTVAAADPAGQRGSPVETLESLTGRRVDEAGGGGEEIETDRDSFTPATTTAPRRRLIVESAYSFIDNRRFKDTHSFPELLLRYGLTDRVELRLGWNHEVGGEDAGTSGFEAGGGEEFGAALERVSQLSYGVKLRLVEQRRWFPRSTLILQAATPTSGPDTATDFLAGWVSGWELTNRWRFDTAIRYVLTREPGDGYGLWAPSAVLKVPVGEKWALHAEYFGAISTGRSTDFSRHYFSPGAHYLVTRNLEVGLRVGWGLNEQTPRFFVNAGFGWQF